MQLFLAWRDKSTSSECTLFSGTQCEIEFQSFFSRYTINSFPISKLISHPKINNSGLAVNLYLHTTGQKNVSLFARSWGECVGIFKTLLQNSHIFFPSSWVSNFKTETHEIAQNTNLVFIILCFSSLYCFLLNRVSCLIFFFDYFLLFFLRDKLT